VRTNSNHFENKLPPPTLAKITHARTSQKHSPLVGENQGNRHTPFGCVTPRADNPYHSPQYDPYSQLGPPDVVVRSRFPLDIIAHRVVDMNPQALGRRVQLAAQFCGYTVETHNEQKWLLCRGSPWRVFTLSVRKLPTTVTIEMISPTRLHIDLLCHSALHISTPGDAIRISRELDELEQQLVHGGQLRS
jgi:hypothetical protein